MLEYQEHENQIKIIALLKIYSPQIFGFLLFFRLKLMNI